MILLFLFHMITNAAAENSVLFIGDSHSYGQFGIVIDETLRAYTDKVTSIASCGSSPSTWVSEKSGFQATNCGYWKKKNSTQEVRTKTHELNSLDKELDLIAPRLTVIALGTNILASPQDIDRELKSVALIMQKLKEHKSACIWIGPPNLNKDPFKHNLDLGVKKISELLQQSDCHFIDSRALTAALTNDSGGIHYGPQASREWGEKTAQQLHLLITKKNLLLLTPKSPRT